MVLEYVLGFLLTATGSWISAARIEDLEEPQPGDVEDMGAGAWSFKFWIFA